MQAIADTELMWVCACGKRDFNHYAYCAACGKERPTPPPDAEPSDVTRGEAVETMPGYQLTEQWRRYGARVYRAQTTEQWR